jgi:hypothetical protein
MTSTMTFGTPVQALTCPPSDVRVDGSTLLWKPGSADRAEPARRDLLDAFLGLRKNRAGLEAFVRRHGALGLCRAHRLPWMHSIKALGEPGSGSVCARETVRTDGDR